MKNNLQFSFFLILGYILCGLVVFCEERIYIKGDKMRVSGKGDIVEFSNNVKLEYKNILLSSNYVRNCERKNVVEAKENVELSTFVNSSDRVKIFADSATLYTRNGKFEFSEKPHIQYINISSNNIVDIYSEYVEYDTSKGVMLAKDNVKICWEGNVAEATLAMYSEKDKMLSLSGRPKVKFQKEKIEAVYQADKINILLDEEKIIFEGKVVGKIDIKNEQ